MCIGNEDTADLRIGFGYVFDALVLISQNLVDEGTGV
jgi:hypothetical protein